MVQIRGSALPFWPAAALLAIFHGAHAHQLAETLRKIAGGGESHGVGDLRQGVIGITEQIAAFLYPALDEINFKSAFKRDSWFPN